MRISYKLNVGSGACAREHSKNSLSVNGGKRGYVMRGQDAAAWTKELEIECDDSGYWKIIDSKNGRVICRDVKNEEEIDFILGAVKERISDEAGRVIQNDNVGIPHKDTMLRAVESAVRRSRRHGADRALMDVAVFSEFGHCSVHAGSGSENGYEECREAFDGRNLNVYGGSEGVGQGKGRAEVGNGRSVCYWPLLSCVLWLVDGTKYRVKLEEITDVVG